MTALVVLGGLIVAAGIFYLVTRVRLARALDSEAYQQATRDRMDHAAWRRHLSVVVDVDGSYVYAAQSFGSRRGGGSHGERQRVEEAVGVVRGGQSLAGGKGSPSGPPCSFCGEWGGGHTGQCPVVS